MSPASVIFTKPISKENPNNHPEVIRREILRPSSTPPVAATRNLAVTNGGGGGGWWRGSALTGTAALRKQFRSDTTFISQYFLDAFRIKASLIRIRSLKAKRFEAPSNRIEIYGGVIELY